MLGRGDQNTTWFEAGTRLGLKQGEYSAELGLRHTQVIQLALGNV